MIEALKHNFDSADEHHDKIQQIGKFLPYFGHDPSIPPEPIYPTIITDCDHLAQILNKTFSALRPANT